MAILDTFSKRKRREARGSEPDVYVYDDLPGKLRGQIVHILSDVLGRYYVPNGYSMDRSAPTNENWTTIRDAILEERGEFTLSGLKNERQDLLNFILVEKEVDAVLDLVEFAFKYVKKVLGSGRYRHLESKGRSAEKAISDLNVRFKENSVGYQFEQEKLIRLDSEFAHAELVKPALALLGVPGFAGAEEEFLKAHGHYRAGDNEGAIAEALKAFESTLKAICANLGWECQKGARASDLVKVVRANGLFPDYLDASFDQLVATLQSGLPKVRNETAGHGQGVKPRNTPAHVAAFAIHLTASKIIFLVEAMRAVQADSEA